MGENLNIALQLTGIGMGMTFLAIGALVLGMYAMTLIVKDRRKKETPIVQDPALDDVPVPWLIAEIDKTAKERAAAAAVAVALAQSNGKQRAAASAVAVALAQQQTQTAATTQLSGWNSFIRSRSVSHRDRFTARRRMQTK